MRYLSIILLSIFFLSCAEEEDTRQVDKAVCFYPVYTTADTRANEIASFIDGDAVGIYVLDKAANSTLKPTGNYADNKKYVWSSEEKAFVAADNDNLIFNAPGRKLEFYVYFPYYDQVIDATALPHIINGVGREDDFLLGINSDMNGEQKIPLSFKHLLSKVNVKYTSTENRENAQMTVNTYTDTKINLATSTTTTITNKRTELPLEKVTTNDYITFSGVIAPQIWKAGEKFGMLTYTGGASHPFSFPGDRKFSAGEQGEVTFMPKTKAYTFSVTPANLSVGASDKSVYPLSITSQKDDAINGIVLPNTTIPVGFQLTSKPDWVTVTGNNVLFTENRDIARTGAVTFTQDESAVVSTVAVAQAAGVVTSNYLFSLDGNSGNTSWTGIAATGDSHTYTVVSGKQIIINGVLDRTENISYTVAEDADWITVSGSTITVQENRGTARANVVTFTQSDSGKAIAVTVSQSAAVVTYGNWVVSVSASPTTIAAGGGISAISANATRDVFTNGIKTSTETAVPGLAASGTGFSLSGATLSASSNLGAARSCTVAASHGGTSKTCTVTQAAGVVTYGNWVVSVFASPTTIAAGGGTSAISANATRDVFTNGVKTSTETATPGLAASGTGFSLSGTTLTASNNMGAARNCIVAASHGGVSNTCTVTQSAANITYGSWNISVSASPTTIAAAGGTSAISANATRDVFTNGVKTSTETATPGLAASGTGFSLSGTTLTASNNMGAARNCIVAASHGGVSNTCTVTQSAANITYGSWNVSVSASPTTIAAAGGTSAISANATRDVFTNGIKTNTETATPGLSSSGTGFSLSGTTLSASSNSGAARTCTVTASHGGTSNTCTVTQSAGVITYNYAFTLDNGSSSASWTGISASGDARSYSISSTRQVIINGVYDRTENVGYSGTGNNAWIGVSGSTITVQENMNTTPRGGNVTFTQAESGKNISITILQLKKSSIDIN